MVKSPMIGKLLRTVRGALASLLLLAGCTHKFTSVRDPASALRASRQDIVSSNTLSPQSLQAVRMGGLTQKSVISEGVDPDDQTRFEALATPLEVAYVESEIAIGRAQTLEKSDPEKAVALYLHAADLTAQAAFFSECRGPFDVRCDSLKVFYQRAVAGVVSYLKSRTWNDANLPIFKTGITREFTLSVEHDSRFEDPSTYDTLEQSSAIGLEGLANRHHRYGVGLDLTACRARRDTIEDRYLPKVGVCLPLTAVLTFPDRGAGDRTTAKLQFYNALTTEHVEVQGVKVPLSADFTAPFASLVDRTGASDWDGLFNALDGNEELLKNTGFYTVEPYTSGKIPLITVHGLFSSPMTWMSIHNDLMGDPEIRARYQVYHYMYPTNLPILENARTFREKLDELHGFIEAHNPSGSSVPQMVVVSHSMGGILTRMTVVPNSEPLKEYFFGKPKEMKKLPDDIMRDIDSYVTFRRREYVGRVIFVAVPHRGSVIADNWIGVIGKWLMSLPKSVLVKTQNLAKQTQNLIRPELRTDFDASDPSSIRSLSPRACYELFLEKYGVPSLAETCFIMVGEDTQTLPERLHRRGMGICSAVPCVNEGRCPPARASTTRCI